jgi:quinol monooxygenase YgiN
MIRVVAIITAKPGRRAEVLAEALAVVPAVRAEEGCLEYSPVIDAEDIGPWQARMGPDVYVVIETWTNAEALAAHRTAPHMAAFGAKTRDMIASRAIQVLSSPARGRASGDRPFAV